MSRPVLSICMPIYNEEKLVPMLLERLRGLVAKIDVPCEVIMCNDGSRDRTLEMLIAARESFPQLRIVSLSRNFGHPQACTAALEASSGDAVVLMDSDLQDPPELILDMLARWKSGEADVVYAQRRSRGESWKRKVFFWAYHRIFVAAAGIKVPVDAGNFCLMDRKVVDVLTSLRERSKYLPGLRAWVGFTSEPVMFDRPDRPDGEPKVSFSKLVKLAVDGLVSFSTWPLKVASFMGFLFAFATVILGIVLLTLRLTGHLLGFPGWTSLALFLGLLGGMILISLGIIGEYLGRIYEEVKARPYYVVGRRYGFPRLLGDGADDPDDPRARLIRKEAVHGSDSDAPRAS